MPVETPVIVGVGLTSESSYVLKKVAGLVGDPGRIIVVHVLERSPLTYLDDTAATLETLYVRFREQAISELKKLCEPLGINRIEVLEGHAAQVLHKLAQDTDARIVAVGTHGYQGWRQLLGETANAVLHDTRNNVLAILTRENLETPSLSYRKILVAVDLSEEMHDVIEEACRVRDRYEGELTLISVIKPPVMLASPMLDTTPAGIYETFLHDAESQCHDRLVSLANKYGVENVMLARGNPATEIHTAAEEIDADLVVLGTHGTHGPALLLGSTPNAVLHGMTCDLLAVRVGLS